jgi:hypothetical protein
VQLLLPSVILVFVYCMSQESLIVIYANNASGIVRCIKNDAADRRTN